MSVDQIAKAAKELTLSFLVIAKRQYERDDRGCTDSGSTDHFFVFARDEGEAVRGVRSLLLVEAEKRLEQAKTLPNGVWDERVKYQFTVKQVTEADASIGTRIFSL